MGSSAKKKREKKLDFQKVKLRVGKTQPKPDNHTNTSFKARSLVLPTQTIAPLASSTDSFDKHISLLDSKTDALRKEALAHITAAVVASGSTSVPLPRPVASFLPRLQGLVLDRSSGVRNQLVKVLAALPVEEVREYCATYRCSPLLIILTGMSHLSQDVRSTSLDVFEWLISVAGDIVVACPGGWIKTINHFLALLKWNFDCAGDAAGRATAATAASLGSRSGATAALFGQSEAETRLATKTLRAFSVLLRAGLADGAGLVREREARLRQAWFPIAAGGAHALFPAVSNQFGPLNLFAAPIDGDSAQFQQRSERQAAYADRVAGPVRQGLAITKPIGGEIGRAAVAVERAVRDGLRGFTAVEA